MNATGIRYVIRLTVILTIILFFALQHFYHDGFWMLPVIASGLIVVYWGVSLQVTSTSMVTLGIIITCIGLNLLGQSSIGCQEIWGLWIIHPLAIHIAIKYTNWRRSNNIRDSLNDQRLTPAILFCLIFIIALNRFLVQGRNFPFSAVLRLLILYLIGTYHQRTQSKTSRQCHAMLI